MVNIQQIAFAALFRKPHYLFIALVLLVGVHQVRAQGINITEFHNGSLTWSGAALGTTCQVQRAVSLVGNQWTNSQSVVVTNNSMTTVVSMFSTSNASVFYRIFGTPAPRISLEYNSGAPGGQNIVSGYGYKAGEYVYFYYGGSYVGYGTAAANDTARRFSRRRITTRTGHTASPASARRVG